jgi:hypothetical protein
LAEDRRAKAPAPESESGGRTIVTDKVVKGPASYFPSIEKKYGRPVREWQALVRKALPAKHMELVAMLKSDHGMGHGHANAIVAHTLAEDAK